MAGRPLRVLFVASECAPWVKTGGLADVVAALPPSLAALGLDVRVCLPFYRSIRREVGEAPACATVLGALVREATLPSGIATYLIDAPWLFGRDGGPYQDSEGRDWPDNAQRFGLFARIAATLASDETPLLWRPDLFHGHDWQAGLGPLWLKNGLPGPAPSIMTIHNLAFQGLFAPETVEALRLPPGVYGVEGAEFYGRLSFLKAGLHYADALTTVSPTYAREIQDEAQGCGLHGLLARRRDHLVGIVNGIDDRVWDPATDPLIPARYDRDSLTGKRVNKEAVQRRFDLTIDPTRPLFGMVGRLTWQKGIDLVAEVGDRLAGMGAQLVVLGTGERPLEDALRALAGRHRGAIAVRVGFDEGLAHEIEAGADIFLMPSRFEPCGLNQMYSQRYGTPPLARATGGLADTIRGVDAGSCEGSGFLFAEATGAALWEALVRALASYRDRTCWTRIMRAGMERDFSWAA
uniref:glycogen synthase GlgA n=1 Tax=Acidiferrobacter sp. TaxID=1872107 RepID=UPI002608D0FD